MVRVRFSPSPTGPLHIGGIRTALFNYLFAKHHKGSVILRIEDTDQNRFVPEAEKHILDSLDWCQMSFDESPQKGGAFGPYRQSERKEIYKKYIEQLIEQGNAYYAFDTREELDEIRKQKESQGKTFVYDAIERKTLKNSTNLSEEQTEKLIKKGNYAIRFKVSEGSPIVIEDMIRGEVSFQRALIEDKILYKSDGMPTYHFANIIDDHLMEISHVIRGEEWLPSVALHKMLYESFGWETPKYAHLPLILKPSGKGKLSKRDGQKLGIPVFALTFERKDHQKAIGYREEGYLPEAIINFLAFMGWHIEGEREIYSMKELIAAFSLKEINSAGAKFDFNKLKWYNHQYIQKQSSQSLIENYRTALKKKYNIEISKKKALQIITHTKERAYSINDFLILGEYFIFPPKEYKAKALKKCKDENAKKYLEKMLELINEEDIETLTKQWIQENNIPMGRFMQLVRIAITGDLKGIHLFHILEIIGKKESKTRITQLMKQIKSTT